MRVDIWSDVVRPRCYVGEARFEKALSTHPRRDEAAVVYHSFELGPCYRADGHGETSPQMLSGKYGLAPAQAREAEGQVASLARVKGLGFDTERPVGNTFGTHRAVDQALERQA